VCRFTVYHTENSNHLDQNIGIIWHKPSMLVIDNTGNVIFLKKKGNRHETTYDSSMGIKGPFLGSSTDMKSWLVLEGFLKQVKNRVSD